MSIQLRTIWQLVLALLFVALAAIALMVGPGGRAETDTTTLEAPVSDTSRYGNIERLDPDTLSTLDRG